MFAAIQWPWHPVKDALLVAYVQGALVGALAVLAIQYILEKSGPRPPRAA